MLQAAPLFPLQGVRGLIFRGLGAGSFSLIKIRLPFAFYVESVNLIVFPIFEKAQQPEITSAKQSVKSEQDHEKIIQRLTV